MWIFAVLFKLNKKGLTFQVLGGKVQVCVRTHSKGGLCEAELLISITLLNFPALASSWHTANGFSFSVPSR